MAWDPAICRAQPKGFRDWLLQVFADGDREHPLYGDAEQYARWGAHRQVRGESQPWPLLRNRRGDLDPFDVYRAAMAATDRCGLAWKVSLEKGREARGPHQICCRFYPGEIPPPRGAAEPKALSPSSQVCREVAAEFSVDERTAYSAIVTALEWATSFGGIILPSRLLPR